MKTDLTHLYFVPGLAAGKEIFRNINLNHDLFKVHILEWLIPKKEESLRDYAQRMADQIKEPNSVLIGISFGGVVAQEMKSFLNIKKVIIVSSVKSKHEFPLHLILAKKTLLYKLVPTRLLLSSEDLTKFAIGPKTKKRLELYQEYLSVRNQQYLDWAIKNMVCWDRETVDQDIIHIHGDQDKVFPIDKIKRCILIKGGTHIMILNKHKWFNEYLPNIINDNYFTNKAD